MATIFCVSTTQRTKTIKHKITTIIFFFFRIISDKWLLVCLHFFANSCFLVILGDDVGITNQILLHFKKKKNYH